MGRKIVAVCIVAAFAMCISFAKGEEEHSRSVPEGKMILRYAEVNSVVDERTMASQQFADIIKEKTKGRIEIHVFSDGALGDNKSVVQNLMIGAIDMCNEPPSNLYEWGVDVPYLEILTLPFLFRNEEHAIKTMAGQFGAQMTDDVNGSGSGLVVLGYFVAGARNFFTKKPCTSLEDFKSLVIRVQQPEVYSDIIDAFGGKATHTSTTELYSALKTGVVDGAENPIKGYYNNKYYEVAKYYTWSNYLIQPSAIIISARTWERLSEQDQELFKQTAGEVIQSFQTVTASRQQKQIQALKEAGVVFSELEDYDAWVSAAKKVYEKYGKGYGDMIRSIRDVR